MHNLLALDLDGTTVNDHGKLAGETREALAAAREKGWLVCFVTGRRDIDMLPIQKECDATDFIVLNNGSKIVRTRDGKVLDRITVDPQQARTVVEMCLEKGWKLMLSRGLDWYVSQMDERFAGYGQRLGRPATVFTRPEEVPYHEADGITILQDYDVVAPEARRRGLDLELRPSEPGAIDVMRKGVNKWKGIQRLSKLAGVPLRKTIAVGNYDNDIEMIQNADIGVAVSSALAQVKQAADYVTQRDHNHAAVAEVIDRFILKKRPAPLNAAH